MLPFVVFSFSCALIAFGFCVWFLVKDRNFWRNEYQTRDREAREREKALFDEMLRLKGVAPLSQSTLPPPAITRKPALDADDLEIIDSRINERVEAGIMTPSEGWMLADQVRTGTKTPKEADAILWKRQWAQQQADYPGSVADID